MFTWVDGHLILRAFLCPIAALWVVGLINTRLARRMQARRSLESYWAGADDYRHETAELEADLNAEDYR